MKKVILGFLLSFYILSTSAQIPDLGSLTDAQKIAYLQSLSASDRALLLRELQGSATAEPLEEVTVVNPTPLPAMKTSQELIKKALLALA